MGLLAGSSSSSSGGLLSGLSGAGTTGSSTTMSPLLMMLAQRQQEQDGGGGLQGLLGNAWEGITGLVGGVATGLVGGALHDVGSLAGNAIAAIPGVDEVEAGIINSTEDKSKLLELGKGAAGFTDKGFHPLDPHSIVGNIYNRWEPLVGAAGYALSGQGGQAGRELSEFGSGLYEDPLGAVLDVASVASAGAAGAAKVGKLGVISKAAEAGEAVEGLSGLSSVAKVGRAIPSVGRTLEELLDAGVPSRTARAAAIRTGLEAYGAGDSLAARILPQATHRLVEGKGLVASAEAYNPLYRAAMSPIRKAMTEPLETFAARGAAAAEPIQKMPSVLSNLADVDQVKTVYDAAQALGMSRIEKPYFASKFAARNFSQLYAQMTGTQFADRNKRIADDARLEALDRFVKEDPSILETGVEQVQGLHTAAQNLESQPWVARQGLDVAAEGRPTVTLGGQREALAAGPNVPLGKWREHWQGYEGKTPEGAPNLNNTEVVPISALEGMEGNALGKTDVSELASAIKDRGLDEAVIVTYDPASGRAFIAEGNHRIAAAKLAGYDHVPVRVTSGSVPEGKGIAVRSLVGKNAHGWIPYDMAPSWIGLPTAPLAGAAGTVATATRMLPETHPFMVKAQQTLDDLQRARETWERERSVRTQGGWNVDKQLEAVDWMEQETKLAIDRLAKHESGVQNVDAVVRLNDEMNLIDTHELADAMEKGFTDPLSVVDRRMRSWQGMYGREKDWSAEGDLRKASTALDKAGRHADQRVGRAQAKAARKVKADVDRLTQQGKRRIQQATDRAKNRVREAERREANTRKAFESAKDPKFRNAKQATWMKARRDLEEIKDIERTNVRAVTEVETAKIDKAAAGLEDAQGKAAAEVSTIDREATKVTNRLNETEAAQRRVDAQFTGGPELGPSVKAFQDAGIPMPTYVPHMDLTKLKMRDFFTSKQRVGANIMAKSPHDKQLKLVLLKRGTMSKDFKDVLTRRVARQVREEETFRLWEMTTREFGKEIADPNMIPNGYGLVAPDLLFINHRSRLNLANKIDEFISRGWEPDSATARAMKETLDENYDLVKQLQDSGDIKMYAVPEVVLKKLDSAAKLSPVFGGKNAQLWMDTPMNLWRGLVLTASPRWLVNNVLGNVAFGFMQGVKTADVMRIGAEKFRVLMTNWWRKHHDTPLLTGPRERSLAGGIQKLEQEAGNVPIGHGYIGTAQEQTAAHLGAEAAASLPGRMFGTLQDSRFNKRLQKMGGAMKSLNGLIEDSWREASFLTAVEKNQGRTAIYRTGRSFMGSKKRIDNILDDGFNETAARAAVRDMEHFFGNYGSMTPFERHVIRRWLFPFWGFYRHSTKLMLTFPFEYPGRAAIFAGLQQVNKDMMDQYGPLPEWLENAIPIGPPGTDTFMTTRGLNPFSGSAEGLGGVANMLGPIPKALFEGATGRSMFTNEPFTDRNVIEGYGGTRMRIIYDDDGNPIGAEPVEKVAPSYLNQILQTVPQVDMLKDLIAGGNTYDTASILDAIQQRFGDAGEATPIDPATGQPFSPTGVTESLFKYGGLPSTEYDLAAYQQRLMEQQQQALKTALERQYMEAAY